MTGTNHGAVIERTDEQRWADAESILDGNPSEFAVQELRRWRRRKFVLIWSLVGFTLLVAAATVVLILVFGHHHGHHVTHRPKVPVWQEIAGLTVNGAGLVVLVVGLVGYFRSGAWGDAWRSPSVVLTRAQRRELSKQLRGRAPLDPDHVRVVRHVGGRAVDPRLRRYFAFLLTGLVLQFLGQMITTPSIGRGIYTVGALVGYAGLTAFWVAQQRKMRTFLEQTRADAVR